MADKKISELTEAATLTGAEEIPLVQTATTKKVSVSDFNKLIAVSKTATAGETLDLDATAYDNAQLIKLSWSGANGTAVYTLPDATAHTNRKIRFISDSTFSTNTHVELTPKTGQNLDGSANDYDINKSYEGIAVWSDGTEWFVIQKKA
tara:strand:- start:1749 stop:2195 length:447 start_codon:yes stop_codon:yes gene_type:complete